MQRFALESSERNTTDDTTRKQIEQEEEAAFPESRNVTRERISTHYDSSPLTFRRHEEPMRNLFCTRNKKIETRRKISQSATICRIFLGGKLARSRSSSSSTPPIVTASHGDLAIFFCFLLWRWYWSLSTPEAGERWARALWLVRDWV